MSHECVLASVMQCLERHDTPAVFGWVCVLFCIGLSVVVSGGVTPGPFPNPEAKPTCADGTAPGRVWESKSPPALKLKRKTLGAPIYWSPSGLFLVVGKTVKEEPIISLFKQFTFGGRPRRPDNNPHTGPHASWGTSKEQR